MKKLFLCVTAVALLAAPTFAVALDKLKIDVNVPINSDGYQNGNTIYGNNNNQTGNIRNSVSIANTEIPNLYTPKISKREMNPAPTLFPSNVTVSGSINAGHSASQLSVINGVSIPELDDDGDPITPTPVFYSLNHGANNTTSDSIVGNNIKVKPAVDTEDLLASIEDLLVNDLYFDGHLHWDGTFVGGFHKED